MIEWSKGLLMVSVFVHYTQCLLFFMSALLLLSAVLFINENCLIETAQLLNRKLLNTKIQKYTYRFGSFKTFVLI